MADETKKRELPVANAGLTIGDVPHSPIIYFENAPALGHVNGLIRVTLSADVQIIVDGAVAAQQVVVAYLRTNIQGAVSLRKALDDALLLAVPTDQPSGKAS